MMNKNFEIITHAVSLIVEAALMAARFSGRVRKRSLKRLSVDPLDLGPFLPQKLHALKPNP